VGRKRQLKGITVMKYTVSILITAFQRPHLLRWGLYSLARQAMPAKFETIVLNDGIPDETETICREFKEQLNLSYIFTGQRNRGGDVKWRVPGYAVNIGAKLAQGEVLILSCAEMFHLNDCIMHLTIPVLNNSKCLGIPVAKDDQDGSFLKELTATGGNYDLNKFYRNYPGLNNGLPFLTSIHREEFISIGGYDEDFTGIGYDDNDLMLRLGKNGCFYYQTAAETIHLYHERIWFARENAPETIYNRDLYYSRQHQIVRNQNREWGKL
jgi:glycosyltransferase involved in cell wall biosynthesis